MPRKTTTAETAELKAMLPETESVLQANHAAEADEMSAPQTEPNQTDPLAEALLESLPADESPQTDPEDIASTEGDIPEGTPSDENPPILQTEPETPEENPEDAAAPEEQTPGTPAAAENSPVLQTDSEVAENAASGKTPRRRRAKTQEDGAEYSQSEVEAAPETKTPQAKPRTARRSKAILSIDEERTVATRRDNVKSDLLDLVESLKAKKILTGTVQGVERSEDNPDICYAVIYHGEFKIIIPADAFVDPPEDFRDRKPSDVMHYLITKRLGAEVDFIVKGADPKTNIAAASRLEAMALKRRQYYFGTARTNANLITEGGSAEARVVSVIRAGIFVDLFGLEVYIPLKELSYQRWMDATSHYQPGQRVLVKILSLDRPNKDNIHVEASVKQAGPNPYEIALRRYAIGCHYVGTVSLVDTTGVFVSLDGGIDCLCSYPKRGRPPRGSRVTVRILGINHEANRIWGAITHMTTR
jgi:hypothetical protein